ncbi:hypothetical protein MEQU1_003580 [Malassezia equina]|uniref:Ribosome biogenesis protein SLX9 n=1 Tax=Malassezia equina TaxID=1381935 RepID=A0AAF0EG87_9BASI|nr:hypothetical protein MEQU1_003580 [Malassezia equina]
MARRREASRKTRSSLSERLALDFKPALSKSSVRRQKQRAREQLAGNQEGLQAMTDVVTSMEASIEATPQSRNANLQRQADPFAALRTHVRNTLDLAPRTVRETDEDMGDT